MNKDKFIKDKTALSDKDYASGTTIFIKKNDTGSGVGAGYTIEIYNNGTKVETIYKDTRKETLEIVKQYKQQYNTSRSFQNEIEVFVTYPEKDSVYEENKVENENQEQKSEASMNSIDTMLMKQAGYIEQLLNRITNPEAPIKIRTAEEEYPMPNNDLNVSNKSISDEIVNKLITFAKKIINDPNKEESDKKNDLYNKIKSWLFNINDTLTKYVDTQKTVTAKYAEESINKEEIKNNIKQELEKFINKPEFALLKETLEKEPGNLEGKNQLSTQEPAQELLKAARFSQNFWKFASTISGEISIEDVFNYYVKENKIEDRKASWEIVEKDIETAFKVGK